MAGIWTKFTEHILDSRLLTQLFMPHKLNRQPITQYQESTANGSALRLRVVINLVLVIVFGGCAIVQLNDPDPAVWVPVYVCPALACGLDILSTSTFELLMGSILEVIHVLYCVVIIGLTAVHVAADFNRMIHLKINEYAREFCGLFMVILWHIYIFLSLRPGLTESRKLKIAIGYIFFNIIFLASAWICFPHMQENSLGHPVGISGLLLSNNTSS